MSYKAMAVSVAVLALGTCVYGQLATYHPGDVVKYQLKLEGASAGLIIGASMTFHMNSSSGSVVLNAHPQEGFANEFGGGCTKSSAPGVAPSTFNCAVTIPPYVASGDYSVSKVSAQALAGGNTYEKDFGVPSISIQNPSVFVIPKLVVTAQP